MQVTVKTKTGEELLLGLAEDTSQRVAEQKAVQAAWDRAAQLWRQQQQQDQDEAES